MGWVTIIKGSAVHICKSDVPHLCATEITMYSHPPASVTVMPNSLWEHLGQIVQGTLHKLKTNSLLFITYYMRCIRKFPDCYCCTCLGERWWDGMPRSHFRKPIISVYHMTQHCEHALLLHKCFFDIVFHFVCDGWKNRATCLHQILRAAW
jgi:hypothetical protein